MKDFDNFNTEQEIQRRMGSITNLLQGDVTLKTLIESIAEGVVVINQSGRIVLINDRISTMTGYKKNEVIGKSLANFLPENLQDRHAQHIRDYFSHPRMRPMGLGFEIIAKRKDDSIFPIEISLSFLKSEQETLGIAFLTDISLRKNAENELKLKNKELDAYAHTVAHDLNSSVSGIIGYGELLLDSGNKISTEAHQEYLKQIVQSGRKMSNVIKELLLFATMKKKDVDITKINMKKIINSALVRLRFHIEEYSAQIIIEETMLDCFGYAAWIEEVWYNFLSNAIKYGGPSPRIKIGSKDADNGYVQYYVKDEGEGIVDEMQAVIFQDANETKDKFTKGMGLGLSIVNRIIEKLEGSVTVESSIGKGSTFSFHLKK